MRVIKKENVNWSLVYNLPDTKNLMLYQGKLWKKGKRGDLMNAKIVGIKSSDITSEVRYIAIKYYCEAKGIPFISLEELDERIEQKAEKLFEELKKNGKVFL